MIVMHRVEATIYDDRPHTVVSVHNLLNRFGQGHDVIVEDTLEAEEAASWITNKEVDRERETTTTIFIFGALRPVTVEEVEAEVKRLCPTWRFHVTCLDDDSKEEEICDTESQLW